MAGVQVFSSCCLVFLNLVQQTRKVSEVAVDRCVRLLFCSRLSAAGSCNRFCVIQPVLFFDFFGCIRVRSLGIYSLAYLLHASGASTRCCHLEYDVRSGRSIRDALTTKKVLRTKERRKSEISKPRNCSPRAHPQPSHLLVLSPSPTVLQRMLQRMP